MRILKARSPRIRLGVDGAAVRLHDGRYDGQAETETARFPGPRLVGAHESFEQVRQQVCVDTRSVIGNPQLDMSGAGHDRRLHGGALRGVHPGVGQQVRDRLVQPGPVTEHPHRMVGHVDQPAVRRRGHRRVVDRIDHQVGEVDLRCGPGPDPHRGGPAAAGRRPVSSSGSPHPRSGPGRTRSSWAAMRCPAGSTRRNREWPPAGCAAHGWRR